MTGAAPLGFRQPNDILGRASTPREVDLLRTAPRFA